MLKNHKVHCFIISHQRRQKILKIQAVQEQTMAFNLTGVDQELFFIGNTIANIGLFVITALPVIILCGVCVLALFFAKDINWPIRVLIINILSAEACTWLSLTLRFLAYAPRARLRGALVICKVVLNFDNWNHTKRLCYCTIRYNGIHFCALWG